jgi:uncharacterized protein (DUF488 family)
VYDAEAIVNVDIWTVGHSTLLADDFIALLHAHGIQALADVRRYPGSRRHPQFNANDLALALERAGIVYASMPELGGRRRPRRDSQNTVWRSESFRGYADYMETAAFAQALARLTAAASGRRTAIMCAEALWWQCHRQMISDALKAQGIRVLHIVDQATVSEHPFTSAARIVDGRLRYGHGADSLHALWETQDRG